MNHSNPKAVWVAAGSPSVPSAQLLAELQKASELVNETLTLHPVAANASHPNGDDLASVCVSALITLPYGDGVAVIDFDY